MNNESKPEAQLSPWIKFLRTEVRTGRLFFMTGNTALVAYHLGPLSFGGLLHSLSMAPEAIAEAEFLMHLNHLGVLTVANVAAGGFTPRRGEPRNDHYCEKD